MSGATCAVVGSKATSIITPHLNNISLNGGDTYTVGASSGDLYSLFSSVLVPGDTGGVPPYSDAPGISVVKDTSSAGTTVNIGAAADGVHNTIFFTGLGASGSFVSFHLTYASVDANGDTATSRYPASGSVLIHRP